jgi:hypothetical protein
VLYKVKWENGGFVTPGNLPQCPDPTGWDAATPYPNTSAIGVSKVEPDGELYQITFTLPPTCTSSTGSGVAKGGNPTNPNSDGFCVPATIGSDPRIVTFTAPAA